MIRCLCDMSSLGTRPYTSSVRQPEINGPSRVIHLNKCVIQFLVISFVELCPFLNTQWNENYTFSVLILCGRVNCSLISCYKPNICQKYQYFYIKSLSFLCLLNSLKCLTTHPALGGIFTQVHPIKWDLSWRASLTGHTKPHLTICGCLISVDFVIISKTMWGLIHSSLCCPPSTVLSTVASYHTKL